jgi:hypothetical protein
MIEATGAQVESGAYSQSDAAAPPLVRTAAAIGAGDLLSQKA